MRKVNNIDLFYYKWVVQTYVSLLFLNMYGKKTQKSK